MDNKTLLDVSAIFVLFCLVICVGVDSVRRLPGKLRVRQSEIIKRLMEKYGEEVQASAGHLLFHIRHASLL